MAARIGTILVMIMIVDIIVRLLQISVGIRIVAVYATGLIAGRWVRLVA